jgi:hypothetical protein
VAAEVRKFAQLKQVELAEEGESSLVEEQSLVAVVVVNNSVKKIEMIIIHRGT